jgi:cysteine sulfinate desulfinase/cysteine desulfurase-like protein
VIVALGQRTQANSLFHFSLGRGSTAEEVVLVEQVLPEIVRRAQLGNNPSFSC